MTLIGVIGLLFTILFFALVIVFMAVLRRQPEYPLRDIPAFDQLRKAVGMAVEAGTRLHISLGAGGLIGEQSAPALIGLTMLERIARAASVSDRPPIATSGEGSLGILSQDVLHSSYRILRAESQYDPLAGRITGLTPFAYAAGTLPVIFDEQVSANVVIGHFGNEVALITDAADRKDTSLVAGTDDIPSQAILYAAAQEPLIGEEVFAGGAYLKAGAAHVASLRAQDLFRWMIVIIILAGGLIRLIGLDRVVAGIIR